VSSARSTSRDIALIAIFCGIVAALGLVPAFNAPGSTVPITAQSLGVMLAGGILGARRGFLALLLFLVLVAVGLPVLSGGRGGLGVFAGASVGFLLAFPVGAYVTGWITERGGPVYHLPWGIVANVIGGILVVYLGGMLGLMGVADLSVHGALVAVLPFLPGDLAKAVIAALVARGVHAAYPGLLGEGRRRGRSSSRNVSAV
jgi:biotin transport system substrate-specific component